MSLPAWIRRPRSWPQVLFLVGAVLLVAMVVHVVAMVLLGGAVSGPVSLRKPATFAETGWLLCWSVALVLTRLRTRAWQRHVVGGAVLAFAVVETTVIGIQAWRGVPSHDNVTTPLDTALMRGGAAGTAAVGLGLAVLLVHAFRMLPLGALDPAVLALLAACVLAYLAALGAAVVATARSSAWRSSAWRYGHSTSATALR